MENENTQRKRRGRPTGKNVQRYNITLDPELAEWARDEPEGLSGLLRDCLQEVRGKRLSGSGPRKRFWLLAPYAKKAEDRYYIWGNRHATCVHGVVIRAESEKLARLIAGANASEEGGLVWTDPEQTWCQELSEHGEDEVVLFDLRNGD